MNDTELIYYTRTPPPLTFYWLNSFIFLAGRLRWALIMAVFSSQVLLAVTRSRWGDVWGDFQSSFQCAGLFKPRVVLRTSVLIPYVTLVFSSVTCSCTELESETNAWFYSPLLLLFNVFYCLCVLYEIFTSLCLKAVKEMLSAVSACSGCITSTNCSVLNDSWLVNQGSNQIRCLFGFTSDLKTRVRVCQGDHTGAERRRWVTWVMSILTTSSPWPSELEWGCVCL